MEWGSYKSATFVWAFFAVLLSQNMIIPVMCRSLQGVEEQKTYYGHDPHTPKSSPKTPSHGTSTPSHGSGGGGKACTPSTPSTTPSTPSGGGGGYHHSPPSSTPVAVPPPVTTTPTTPSTPATPSSPPFVPDPNNFPPFFTGTCNYWKNHPNLIWGLCGFWGTVGSVFGVASASPAFGSGLSLTEALANTRNDGYGSLFREGTASLLNSMVNKKFHFTTQQVKENFSAALLSDKAAGSQAKLFKQANEGKLKPRA